MVTSRLDAAIKKISASEVSFSFARSSGSGGQHVNKVSTKAVMRWHPAHSKAISKPILLRFQTRWHNQLTSQGDLVLASDSYRDQPRNIEHCLLKLRQLLSSVWVAPKVRKPTKPTKASKERRLKAKKQRSEHKKTRQKVDW